MSRFLDSVIYKNESRKHNKRQQKCHSKDLTLSKQIDHEKIFSTKKIILGFKDLSLLIHDKEKAKR